MKTFSMQKQGGFVLAVSMIFLLIMTVLAITAIKRSTLGETVAGNLRAQNMAFQAAEKALRYCESIIELRAGELAICKQKTGLEAPRSAIVIQSAAIVPGDNPLLNYPVAWRTMANWTGATPLATTLTGIESVANVASQPQCMIEVWRFNLLPGSPPTAPDRAYVVTARGVGNYANAVVWLQETIRCGTS
jgi:type IV pilus assembly protein PilX